jgi:hypothetical protein
VKYTEGCTFDQLKKLYAPESIEVGKLLFEDGDFN